jgi:hypothetical protein
MSIGKLIMNTLRRADARRIYIREHPLALWFSIGAMLTGLPLLLAPYLGNGSAALEALPPWAVTLWAASYALGGGLSVYGMAHLRVRFEAAGMALLASALSVTVVAILMARGIGSLLSVAFLATLVIGCASRTFFLATRP